MTDKRTHPQPSRPKPPPTDPPRIEIADTNPELPRRAYSAREVAAMFGLGYETVLRLIHRHELNARKAGRYWVISTEEIDRYLKAAA